MKSIKWWTTELSAEYTAVCPRLRSIFKDIRQEKHAVVEFDDSPEDQAVKYFLFDFIPAVGGRVFAELDKPWKKCWDVIPVYCITLA